VQVVRQNHRCIDAKSMACLNRAKRVAERSYFLDKQSMPFPVSQVDGEEPGGARYRRAAVLLHGIILRFICRHCHERYGSLRSPHPARACVICETSDLRTLAKSDTRSPFGSSQGLGYMIASAATNYKVDVVFVGVAIFMALSVILTLAVKQLESRLASWRPETAKTF